MTLRCAMDLQVVTCLTTGAVELTGRIRWVVEHWSSLLAIQGKEAESLTMKCAGHEWVL
jgi:hypothetical protein